MRILSISTSSNIATVAILEDDKTILELNINNTKTHSETLMPLVEEILKETKLSLSEIGLIACDVGPRFFYWNKNRNFNCKGYFNVTRNSNSFSNIFGGTCI